MPDVPTFVHSCIHCLSTTGGEKVPRQFGPAVHGTKANDLLQFNYIEISQSPIGETYLLIWRDDHSDYKYFFRSQKLLQNMQQGLLSTGQPPLETRKVSCQMDRLTLRMRRFALYRKVSKSRTISRFDTSLGVMEPLNDWAKTFFVNSGQCPQSYKCAQKNDQTSSHSYKVH